MLLDEPGGRSETLLAAIPSREEVDRVTMECARERKPVYFAQASRMILQKAP